MDNKNQFPAESGENKSKKFWKGFGIGALAVFLALFTVLVINL